MMYSIQWKETYVECTKLRKVFASWNNNFLLDQLNLRLLINYSRSSTISFIKKKLNVCESKMYLILSCRKAVKRWISKTVLVSWDLAEGKNIVDHSQKTKHNEDELRRNCDKPEPEGASTSTRNGFYFLLLPPLPDLIDNKSFSVSIGAVNQWPPTKHHLPGVWIYDGLWCGLLPGLSEYDVRTVFEYIISNMLSNNIELHKGSLFTTLRVIPPMLMFLPFRFHKLTYHRGAVCQLFYFTV